MKSNASLIYGLLLMVGDFLALMVAFAGAYALRGPLSNTPVAHPIAATTYLGIFLLLTPFWLLIFGLMGLYTNSIHEKRFVEAGRLLIGSFVGLLFVSSYAYISDRVVFPSKLVPVYGFAIAFVLLLIFRNTARYVRSALFRYDIGITNLLLVGNTHVGRQLVDILADRRVSGYRIVGVVGGHGEIAKRYPHIPFFKSFSQAIAKINSNDIHGIVQTELYADNEENNEVLEFAQTKHIAYRFVPGNSELFVGNIAVELFRGSVPVIAVHQTALIGWGRIVKRVTDVIVGGLMFIVALPFMLLIAIAEKLSDPSGPIFYREIRLSRFNTKVRIFKFRSMKRAYTDMSPEKGFTKMGRPELIKQYRQGGDRLSKDPRVSRLGRFLRRTSLDELPQLVNVVRGDISLVGPRALIPAELGIYEKRHAILSVKSGLTGLAQVSGRRDISFEERRKLDLYYVQNWSIWLDLVILIKTVRAVVKRSGAV